MARQAKIREAKDVVCKGSLLCESATRYSQLLKSLRFVSGSGRHSGKLCREVVAFRCAHGGKGFQDDDLRRLFAAGVQALRRSRSSVQLRSRSSVQLGVLLNASIGILGHACKPTCFDQFAAADTRGKLCREVVAFRCAHGGKGFQDDDLRRLFAAGVQALRRSRSSVQLGILLNASLGILDMLVNLDVSATICS